MSIQLAVFSVVFVVATGLGFFAARWRRPPTIASLEQWGLGGRAFGNWVTWFLMGGDIYTAYTLMAVPALVFLAGPSGFWVLSFAAITYPMAYLPLTRLWSVSHANGFVTTAEFVRARFDSRSLSVLVALTGIVATMPYLALQLIGMEVVLTVLGLKGGWPLTGAFLILALYTVNSGLRAPALISIVKDVLLLWAVLATMLIIAMSGGGWKHVFQASSLHFPRGLLLPQGGQFGYLTLVLGSALALFLYPHTVTGVLAARNRGTVKRNLAALPVYSLALGIVALLGFAAIAAEVKPAGGDRNAVVASFFFNTMPAWSTGMIFAAIGVGALVPAAIMSIAAANLFTRSIYREFFRPGASPAEEVRVSRIVSFGVKLGAVAVVLGISPQYAVDFQLIGGVIILQTLPAVVLGLYTSWPHRTALIAGMGSGLLTGLVMLYQIPTRAPSGAVLRAHFGGSSWQLSKLGLDTVQTVYAGLPALAVNLVVTIGGTLILRALLVPTGIDRTEPHDYIADEGDANLDRMTQLIDGVQQRREVAARHLAGAGRRSPPP
jgi:solute:Na+ symporter, SSS family